MKSIIRMTPGGIGANGLIVFRLAFWVGNKEVEHFAVNSGQAGVQNLRTYEDEKSIPGNMEPIPEGVYGIKSDIAWAGGKDNWDVVWNAGLGPFLIDLVAPKEGEYGFRSLFRIHKDGNRAWAPGSAGCPVTMNQKDSEEVVEAFRKCAPTELVVDYGLGTVSGAPGKVNKKDKTKEVKDDTRFPTMSVRVAGKVLGEAYVIDGKSVPTMPLLVKMLGGALRYNKEEKVIDVNL